MNLVSGIKRTVKNKGISYGTTDGRVWDNAAMANEWQKKLNKKAVKVLEGKNPCKAKGKTPIYHNTHGKGNNVGTTPEKRRAIRAFVMKWNISKLKNSNASGCVISMNRLLWAIQNNPKAVREFAELFAIP